MKFTDLVFTLAAAGSFVAAQPHRHHHRHVQKRSPNPVADAADPVVTTYELNGKIISLSEVCAGIDDGSLQWAPGTENTPDCGQAPAVSTPTPTPTHTTSTATGGEFLQAPATTTTTPVPAASPPPASNPSPAAQPVGDSSGGSSSGLTGYDAQIASGTGLTTPFPDGQLDCSTFPIDYGAIPVNWQGIGGWSGIQYVTIEGDVVTNINTAVAHQSEPYCAPQNGNPAMCSYACPPGYQKSQWPSTQGATGQSVGGLMCGTDNKLHLTNPGLSNSLCIKGTGVVNVQNKLSTNAAICRTDYPGDEGETIPLDTQAGSTNPLTCPDASTYYQHMGMSTSAQYYINMAGFAVENACNWSTDGSYEGNWAPITLGVGTDTYGKSWLSIQSTQQNFPTTYKALDYTIELIGDLSGTCFFTQDSSGNGLYCSSGTPSSFDAASDCVSYDINLHPVPGCTVEVMSGQASYVLTPLG